MLWIGLREAMDEVSAEVKGRFRVEVEGGLGLGLAAIWIGLGLKCLMLWIGLGLRSGTEVCVS